MGMETRAGLGAEQVAQFWRDGYLVVRGVFDRAEMDVLREVILRHEGMNAHADRAREKSAGPTRPSFDTIFVWNDDGRPDVFSKATRSRRVIDPLEALFADEVYVYHNKVALKYPGVVGFSHHQDYAYWYEMGNVFPDMATVSIAIDDATRENGCLRLVCGSHRLGRLNHVERDPGSDRGVDPERLEHVLKVLPEHAIELASGDMVIFHCNTLHASDDNHSGQSRLALLGCYNTRHNSPYKTVHGHPRYERHARISERITRADLEKLPEFV